MIEGTRLHAFERGEFTDDGFRFGMTLATEGEASDGHILSIRGGQTASPTPLQLDHVNSPAWTLGSITDPRKDLEASPARLAATGTVHLKGSGNHAEDRRDVAELIHAGHVRQVSIRWQSIQSKPRRNLPEDHPAYVDSESEKNIDKRWGLYFEKWRTLEGSVVAIGSDPQALIDRADASERAEAADFLRTFAAHAGDEPPIHTPIASVAAMVERALDLVQESELPTATVLEALAESVGLVRVCVAGHTLHVPRESVRDLAELELGRFGESATATPTTPANGRSLSAGVLEAIRTSEAETLSQVRGMLEQVTGRRLGR